MGLIMQIRKAERKKAKLRLGLAGASDSGKTWSALEIAHGIGGKIAMIDTEAGRGELYAGSHSAHEPEISFQYDVIRLDAPFSPERYIEAMRAFEKAGYDILIIDSLSHAWEGPGGVLTIVGSDGWFSRSGQKGSSEQNALTHAIITSKMHIIANMRAKTEWAMEKDSRGKNCPIKVGLAPVQRGGIEYEFTAFMNMSHDRQAFVSKDTSKIYSQKTVQPSPDMGRRLMEWLNTGIDEKEIFSKETIPVILNEINSIKSTKELSGFREKYIHYQKLYGDTFPEEFKAVVEAKDAKREALMLSELDTMAPPPIIVPAITNKYSPKLVQNLQGIA
jgi:hypothetical protein